MDYNTDSKGKRNLGIILFIIITIALLPSIYNLGKRVYINAVGNTVQGYVDKYDVDRIEYSTKNGKRYYKVYTPLITMKNEDGYLQLKSSYNRTDGLKYKDGDTLEMKYINNDLVTAVIADPFYIHSKIIEITSAYAFIGILLALINYDGNKKGSMMSYFNSLSEKQALKLIVKRKKRILLLITPGLVNALLAIDLNNSFYNEKSCPAIFYTIFIGIYIIAFGNLIFNAIKLRRVKELD